MRAPLRRTLAAASAVVLATSLGAVSALAATVTWTVSPGGGAGGLALGHLTDTTTGAKFDCRHQAVNLRFKKGSGQVSPIGIVIGFSTCAPRRGEAADRLPSANSSQKMEIRAASYDASTGVTTGKITGLQLSLSARHCDADVDGATASEGATLQFKYTNGTGDLSLFTTPSNLHFFNVSSSCSSVLNINNGDPATFHGIYHLSPAQIITSP
jgi:hypothetical protein